MSLVLVEDAGKLLAKSSRWLPALNSFRNGKCLRVGITRRDTFLYLKCSVQAYCLTISWAWDTKEKEHRTLKWTNRYFFFEIWDKIRRIELILCNVSIHNISIYPRSKVLCGRLTDLHLVKKFPTFYGSWKWHHLIQKRQLPVPILSQSNPIHASSNHLLKIPS
jgi:hypothetical protein